MFVQNHQFFWRTYGSTQAEESMKELNNAKEVLLDVDARELYDRPFRIENRFSDNLIDFYMAYVVAPYLEHKW